MKMTRTLCNSIIIITLEILECADFLNCHQLLGGDVLISLCFTFIVFDVTRSFRYRFMPWHIFISYLTNTLLLYYKRKANIY